MEVIRHGSKKYIGVKGIELYCPREMDEDLPMSDDKKKSEYVMHSSQVAFLCALTVIFPVANRMFKENMFTSLTSDLNKAI